MPLSPEVLRLFASQHGLLSRSQARNCLSAAERRTLYHHCEIERVSPRVLRHRASPVTLGTQLGVPVLDSIPSSCLWERSAALWMGFGRDRRADVHLARRQRPRPDALGIVHHIDDLDPVDVMIYDGLPTARAERVILSLAATETRKYRPSRLPDRRHGEDLVLLQPAVKHIGGVLDQAWSAGLIDGEFIHDMTARLAERGRNGIVVLRECLRKRPPDYLPPESGTERRFEEIVGDDWFDRQARIDDELGFVGRVDYVATRWPLIIEVNGEIGHSTLTDRARDDARYERLLALGYSVLVIWQYDIWQTPHVTKRLVARIRRNPDRVPTLHRPTPPPWELFADRASIFHRHST